MDIRRGIAVAAAVVGLASGQRSLQSAAASQPPLAWNDLAFVFIGSTISMTFVVGFQLLRKDPKYGLWALRFITPITIFIAASGVGALAVGLHSGQRGPAAWFFLACGIG